MIANVIQTLMAALRKHVRNNVAAHTARLAIAGMVLVPGHALAEKIRTDLVAVEANAIVTGLDHPWGLDFLPGGAVLITERSGRLLLMTAERQIIPVSGLPKVAVGGQGGLLDVAASPEFSNNGLIFLSFSEPGRGGSGTAVVRGKLEIAGDKARLEDAEIIFSMKPKSRGGRHFGSRLVFHPDGTLFITTGDRGERDRAQEFDDHAGAVIRVNPDGSIPENNPFTGDAKTLSEIWSKGHRNPQGAIFDPVTQTLWVVEHGARGGDELNQPQAGKNYGWPVISYGRHYSGFKIGVGTEAAGYEQPVWYWDPSIAPSGLAVYQGDMFPEWRGDFLVGALKFRLLSRLDRGADGKISGEERMFDDKFGRIRDVNIAPDGSIWLLTDEDNGAVVRLTRAE